MLGTRANLSREDKPKLSRESDANGRLHEASNKTFLRSGGLLLFHEMLSHAADVMEREKPGDFRRHCEYQPEAVQVEVKAACFLQSIATDEAWKHGQKDTNVIGDEHNNESLKSDSLVKSAG